MEDGKQLILQAFEQARAAGKPDWFRMTTAVLKNRLLSLTGNVFSEAAYGATSFTNFIARYGDIVDLDRSSFPPVVELRQVDSGPVPGPGPGPGPTPGDPGPGFGRPRVRSDLWRAALDYSSGTQYVWDENAEQARPAQPGEDGPVIPTVSQEVHQQWREEFINDVESELTSPEHEYQVNNWIQHQLPTSHLPRHLIGRWNGFLRDRVLDYLMDWFDESEYEPPADMFATVAVERRTHGQGHGDAEQLRQLILRTVREMSAGELAQLNLPAGAVLRATRLPR